MKVLVVIESLGFGGAERLLVTLLPELKSRGVECDVAILFPPYSLQQELIAAGVKVYPLGIAHRWSIVEALWKLRRILATTKYNAVWGHLYFGNMYAMLAGIVAGINTRVMTLHSPIDCNKDRLWVRFRLGIEKRLGNAASKIVAVSKNAADAHRQQFGWGYIGVIHNAIPVQHLPTLLTKREKESIRRSWQIGNEDFLLVTAARFSSEKGHEIMMNALLLFREKYGWSPRWIAAGSGALKKSLMERAVILGLGESVRFSESLPQRELFQLIQTADVFVLPSLQEQFGIAAGEAMALGIPCILSEVGGLPELAGSGEECAAKMVKSGDPVALCDAIWQLYSSSAERERLAGMGKVRISLYFDAPAVADKWACQFQRGEA